MAKLCVCDKVVCEKVACERCVQKLCGVLRVTRLCVGVCERLCVTGD